MIPNVGRSLFCRGQEAAVEDDHTSLTTIQALGLIAIREASCGRDYGELLLRRSSGASGSGVCLHMEVTDKSRDSESMEHDVRAATFWGAFALDH